MGLWKKAQAHARHHRGKKNLPFGRFPLRFCSLGDHLGGDAAARDRIPGAAPPGRFKVKMLPELQKGKSGNASISLSPYFVVSVSAFFPKLCFGQTCFYGSEKNSSVKKVVFLAHFKSVLK